MSEEPEPVVLAPICQATWSRQPGIEPGACGRPARWVITGEDGGGEVLYTGHACDTAQHQAQLKAAAWQEYNVSLVKLRRRPHADGQQSAQGMPLEQNALTPESMEQG